MTVRFRVSRFAFRAAGRAKALRLCAGLLSGTMLMAACSRQPAPQAAEVKPAVEPVAAAVPDFSAIPDSGPLPQFDGAAALQYTREVVAFGPRWPGSPGHTRTQNYLRARLKADRLEIDTFTASTPVGPLRMANYIAKFPGTKDGIIVVAGHYDTLYDRPDFVGANDAGSSTGLLLQLAKTLRAQMTAGKLQGYGVWLVWLDGEEAIRQWSDTDSLYGSRHLAEKWQQNGTLAKLKGFLLVDMIGDADLNIVRDTNSTGWMSHLVWEAARRFGYQSHFFAEQGAIQDDHVPFLNRGVPAVDLIDFNYGYNNSYWHTKDDTLDKLSPRSFELVGRVVQETIRLLNQK